MKKIVVDADKCFGCGACVSICNKVFDFSDDGVAFTKENENIIDNMDEDVKDEALDALEGCPASAIKEEEIDDSLEGEKAA